VSTSQIQVTWTGNDTNGPGIKNYTVYRGSTLLSCTSSPCNDMGLAANTSYTYTVYIYDTANDVGSGTVTKSTLATITDSATMTEGGTHYIGQPNLLETWKGYDTGSRTFGSLSPSALSGGKVVTALYDYCQAISDSKPPPPTCPFSGAGQNTQFGVLSISGFTADPGATWLTSVTAAGATRYGSSASYSYASGIATWQWIGPVGSGAFGLSNSGTTTVTITHKP
jgi:hypothetical protein